MSEENRYTPTDKGPVAPTVSALKGGVALQVASWKVLRYRGVSQLHCHLSRCSGAANENQKRSAKNCQQCLACATKHDSKTHSTKMGFVGKEDNVETRFAKGGPTHTGLQMGVQQMVVKKTV